MTHQVTLSISLRPIIRTGDSQHFLASERRKAWQEWKSCPGNSETWSQNWAFINWLWTAQRKDHQCFCSTFKIKYNFWVSSNYCFNAMNGCSCAEKSVMTSRELKLFRDHIVHNFPRDLSCPFCRLKFALTFENQAWSCCSKSIMIKLSENC